MKIYNEDKTKLLEISDCDLTKGYFKEETIITGERNSLIENKNNVDGSISTIKYNKKEIEKNIIIYTLFSQKDLLNKELKDLEDWFNNEYRKNIEKCSRKIALGLNLKDATNPQAKLTEIYSQAEINSNRINEIKELLK